MPCFDDNSKNHQQFLRLKTPTVSKSRHNTKLVAPLKGGSSETINKSRNCVLVCREIESMSVFQSLMIEENVISSDTKKLKTNKQTKKKRKKKRRIYCFGDLEQITEIVPFSVTLGLLVRLKMKESL